jgi:hypothetical protein
VTTPQAENNADATERLLISVKFLLQTPPIIRARCRSRSAYFVADGDLKERE